MEDVKGTRALDWAQLPDDCLVPIFEKLVDDDNPFVAMRNLAIVAQVCKPWNALSFDSALWKPIISKFAHIWGRQEELTLGTLPIQPNALQALVRETYKKEITGDTTAIMEQWKTENTTLHWRLDGTKRLAEYFQRFAQESRKEWPYETEYDDVSALNKEGGQLLLKTVEQYTPFFQKETLLTTLVAYTSLKRLMKGLTLIIRIRYRAKPLI